jgi:uncharacterized protein
MLDISRYYIFLLPITTWFIIQGIKFIIYSIKHGWNIRETLIHIGYGHMPSAHTGFVTSLVTSVGYYAGMDSGAFAVAVVFAIMIIDDSVRLRMHIGDQGYYFNRLITLLHMKKEDFPKLKERMGHKISEVIVGGILGFSLTLFMVKLLEKYPLVF